MKFIIKEFDELSTYELYKIIQVRINVFVVEQNCPYEECDDKDFDSYHLYYEDNENIAAYLRIIAAGVSYPEPSIGRVLVKKEYRRQGLASEMMKKAIEFIKENFKSEAIRISAQKYLLEFYQDLGFERVSEKYLEDDIPHYEMLCEF
ncbi:GNAT family N-acetyltransferase [Halanaerobium hydrogeniformans]|uniref:GCN5-related N-acetyltransferase n=1 Tax=Halanaerobium hydrogeniformans TaxID=656519 RepID=E4RM42_HALHG|nr:GNAT family N-acetyltransferase [Halanaerobium hydrogeniformans]ADQ14373.1 GCN5-related N-acetyltransferase [Halanaerobium hydrogeniformans]